MKKYLVGSALLILLSSLLTTALTAAPPKLSPQQAMMLKRQIMRAMVAMGAVSQIDAASLAWVVKQDLVMGQELDDTQTPEGLAESLEEAEWDLFREMQRGKILPTNPDRERISEKYRHDKNPEKYREMFEKYEQ